MKILQHYLILTLAKAIGIVVILLAAISGIIELLREIAQIGTGHYTIAAAFIYVLTTIPQHIYEFFPMASLLGGILGLGILASRSEIIAMRAAGLSLSVITVNVLKAIIILALLIMLLGETFIPKLRLWAEHYKTLRTSSGQIYTLQRGMWLRDGDNFIHINTVASPTQLFGITRYQLDDKHKLVETGYAEQATYHQGIWQLNNIKRSLISNAGIQIEQLDSAPWHIKLPPQILKVAIIEPLQMNIVELYQYIQYRKQAGLTIAEYALSFWQRILQPFASAVMILIAVPFISGSLRSATMGLRLFLGVVIGFLFYILNQLFGPISQVYQLPSFMAAALPTILFAIVGFILLRKTR